VHGIHRRVVCHEVSEGGGSNSREWEWTWRSSPRRPASTTRSGWTGRITKGQHAAAVTELKTISTEIDHSEITAELIRNSGDLAQASGVQTERTWAWLAPPPNVPEEVILRSGSACCISGSSDGSRLVVRHAHRKINAFPRAR